MNIYDHYNSTIIHSTDFLSMEKYLADERCTGEVLRSLNRLRDVEGCESVDDVLSLEYKVHKKSLNIKREWPGSDKQFLKRLSDSKRVLVNIPPEFGDIAGPSKTPGEWWRSVLTFNWNRTDHDYDSDTYRKGDLEKIKRAVVDIDKELKKVGWTICRENDLKVINIMENETDEAGRAGRVVKSSLLKTAFLGSIAGFIGSGAAFIIGGIAERAIISILGAVGYVSFPFAAGLIATFSDADPDMRAAVSRNLGGIVVFGTTMKKNHVGERKGYDSGSKLFAIIRSVEPDSDGKYGVNVVNIAVFRGGGVSLYKSK